MKYTYTINESLTGTIIARTDENGNVAFIPKDLGNSDYQAYLKSLDEASTL